MKKKQTKILVIVGVVVVAVIAIVVAVNLMGGEEAPVVVEETEAPKKRISAPVNVIALEERPVVTLQPFGKDGGRFVSIQVSEVRKDATEAEFDFVYNVIGASAVNSSGAQVKVPETEAQEGQQGDMGDLDLSSLPTSTENRFGTCSAGGACINNNVSGGLVTINFDGPEAYAVGNTWTYFETGLENSETEDGAFAIEAAGLAEESDYLIMQAMGLPAGLTGSVMMVPDGGKDNGTVPVAYQINFTDVPDVTEALVTFPGQESLSVAVWDGEIWTNYTQDQVMPVGSNYFYVLLSN